MFVLPADMIYEEGFQHRCFNDVDLHWIWVNKILFVCLRMHDCHSNFFSFFFSNVQYRDFTFELFFSFPEENHFSLLIVLCLYH